jgi:hypothetical protein
MQLTPTIPASSGKLAGVVATRSRIGAQFLARVARSQPRSVSQQNARAFTGGLAGYWRLLTPAEHDSWSQLAAAVPVRDALGQVQTLSGYALYVACSRRLLTIGITERLSAAPCAPSLPAVHGFTATPTYNVHSHPMRFLGWTLNLSENLPWGPYAVLRATAFHSPVKSQIRASDLRVIDSFPAYRTNTRVDLAEWEAVFGYVFQGGVVTFSLNLVDPISGLAGPSVRAARELTYTPPPAYQPLLIETEGEGAAELWGETIEVDGESIAASQ